MSQNEGYYSNLPVREVMLKSYQEYIIIEERVSKGSTSWVHLINNDISRFNFF